MLLWIVSERKNKMLTISLFYSYDQEMFRKDGLSKLNHQGYIIVCDEFDLWVLVFIHYERRIYFQLCTQKDVYCDFQRTLSYRNMCETQTKLNCVWRNAKFIKQDGHHVKQYG